MRFGELLARLRADADLSQDEIAEKTGVPRGTIALAEQGKRSIKLKHAEKLADFFRLKEQQRKDFLDAANLTRITKAGSGVGRLLEEARAQVRFLSSLVGIGVPVEARPDEVEKYGAEAAEKLAAARRANQQLYDRLMEVSGKKKPPAITGAEEIPDCPLAPPAAPLSRRRPKREKSS